MKAQKELRVVAVAMLLLAVFLLVTVGSLTPTYMRLRTMQWDRMFQSANMYREFMTALTAILYVVAPGMAVLLAGAGATVLKHHRKVRDDANAA
jgi:hypothetical protein